MPLYFLPYVSTHLENIVIEDVDVRDKMNGERLSILCLTLTFIVSAAQDEHGLFGPKDISTRHCERVCAKWVAELLCLCIGVPRRKFTALINLSTDAINSMPYGHHS